MYPLTGITIFTFQKLEATRSSTPVLPVPVYILRVSKFISNKLLPSP